MEAQALKTAHHQQTNELPKGVARSFLDVTGVSGLYYMSHDGSNYEIWVLTDNHSPETRLEIMDAYVDLVRNNRDMELEINIRPLDGRSFEQLRPRKFARFVSA